MSAVLEVDGPALRRVLGSFASGVVVVTGSTPDGPVGMTCQSFASVSLEPPLVLFCPARTSASWPRIQVTGRFVVNVLAADQQEVCQAFAQRREDKFAGIGWTPSREGPVLDGALAQVHCDVADVHPAGDHLIVVGAVRQLGLAREHGPLLFFRGGYGVEPC